MFVQVTLAALARKPEESVATCDFGFCSRPLLFSQPRSFDNCRLCRLMLFEALRYMCIIYIYIYMYIYICIRTHYIVNIVYNLPHMPTFDYSDCSWLRDVLARSLLLRQHESDEVLISLSFCSDLRGSFKIGCLVFGLWCGSCGSFGRPDGLFSRQGCSQMM